MTIRDSCLLFWATLNTVSYIVTVIACNELEMCSLLSCKHGLSTNVFLTESKIHHKILKYCTCQKTHGAAKIQGSTRERKCENMSLSIIIICPIEFCISTATCFAIHVIVVVKPSHNMFCRTASFV